MPFTYGPLSRRQLEVIADPNPAPITVLHGSVRSGKTIASIIRWINYVRYETSPGSELLMLGVTSDTLYRNVVSVIEQMAGPVHAQYKDGLLTLFGRKCWCIGAKDKRAEAVIRGMTVEGSYVDEATQIPIEVIRQAPMRCSAGKGLSFWTTNPDSPYAPIYTEFIGNDDLLAAGEIKRFHFTLRDNLNLPDQYVRTLDRIYRGVWHRRMVLGLWVVAEGLIYDQFTPDRHGFRTGDLPRHKDGRLAFDYYDLCLDYGTQNPLAAYLVGSRGKESWYLKEYYWDGRERQRQLTDTQYADDLERFVAGFPLRKTFIDPSAASMKAEMQQRAKFGFLTAADNDVSNGIRTVSTRFNLDEIRVNTDTCPNLVRELQSYAWDPRALKRGEDAPLKQHDHGPDALRYREFTVYGRNYVGVEILEGSVA